jgi:prefoldin alpha subunit
MSQNEAELHMLDAQARMIADQLDKVENSLMEVEYLKGSLDELKRSKEGSDVLAALNNGIFVKARLEKNSTLLVNVGNGIVVEKTVDETKALLQERVVEMEDVRKTLVQQLQKLEERLIELGEH